MTDPDTWQPIEASLKDGTAVQDNNPLEARTRESLVAEQTAVNERLAATKAKIAEVNKAAAAHVLRIKEEAKRDQIIAAAIAAELGRRKTAKTVMPSVSDHAIVRYIERHLGLGEQIRGVRRSILSEDVKAQIKAGAQHIETTYGRCIVQDGVIVTILDIEMLPSRSIRKAEAERAADAAAIAAYAKASEA